ncbi:hypothetical protein BH23GEM1_BH23GEM1_08220 [soil metagenome]
MNRIRTVAAAVAMLVSAATVASAQTPAPQDVHAGKAHRGAHGMMGHLDLSDAQKEQMKAIHAKYRVQFQQLRESSRPDMQAARTARQAGDTAAARAAMARVRASQGTATAALRQQQQAEVRAILTAEQRTQLDARQAQMRERMAQRDSTQRKAGPRGMQGKRPNRGARPGRTRGQG